MDREHPITCRSMIGLRCTAAVVTMLPSVRARLREDDEVVLEVTASTRPTPHRVVCPCGFRRSIADAHRRRSAGEQLVLRGVESGAPSIEWGVAPGELTLPGSMVRVAHGGDWLHAAAVAAPIELCEQALAAVPATTDPEPGLALLGAPDLDVTLLCVATEADEAASAAAIDAVQAALARVAVHVLLEGVEHRPAWRG